MELRAVNLSGVNISTGGGGPSGPIVTSGLQLQLRPSSYFGGSTWTDTQGNANATLYGSPTYSSTGFFFDGTTTYGTLPSIPDVTDFGNTGSFTLEIWFRASSSGNPLGGQIMLEKWNGQSGAMYATPYAATYSLLTLQSSFGSQSPNSSGAFTFTSDMMADTWYQTVCVWNYTGSEIAGNQAYKTTAYKNTVAAPYKGNLSIFPNSPSNNFIATIARRRDASPGDSNPSWFKGNIGIIRIYNRALSQEEISQNFNGDKGIFGI